MSCGLGLEHNLLVTFLSLQSAMKGIIVLNKNASTLSNEDPFLVASAASDGIIRVWDVRMAVKEKPNPLAEANTNSKITCLARFSLKCEFSSYFMPSSNIKDL